jgi:hypothetical protein
MSSSILLLLGALAAGSSPPSSPKPKPHILLIVADDQGHAQVGYHNASTPTPRIDALAKAGVTLENYYVQPVCSPTRSTLMYVGSSSHQSAATPLTTPLLPDPASSLLLLLLVAAAAPLPMHRTGRGAIRTASARRPRLSGPTCRLGYHWPTRS